MRFDWDEGKARSNVERHGVTFEEATALFLSDVDVLEIYDLEHSEAEDRFKSIGPIKRGIVLVVWTDRRNEIVRLISARMATAKEEALYASFLGEIGK